MHIFSFAHFLMHFLMHFLGNLHIFSLVLVLVLEGNNLFKLKVIPPAFSTGSIEIEAMAKVAAT